MTSDHDRMVEANLGDFTEIDAFEVEADVDRLRLAWKHVVNVIDPAGCPRPRSAPARESHLVTQNDEWFGRRVVNDELENVVVDFDQRYARFDGLRSGLDGR